jgi:hypothetical protein
MNGSFGKNTLKHSNLDDRHLWAEHVEEEPNSARGGKLPLG